MFRRTEVLARVPVRRIVAAADVTADHAEPEVDPLRANAQAVFAAVGAWGDFADLIEMRAASHPSTVGRALPGGPARDRTWDQQIMSPPLYH